MTTKRPSTIKHSIFDLIQSKTAKYEHVIETVYSIVIY